MSSNDGVWPWGECEHADQGVGRRWCSCGEWCFEPGSEAREMIHPDDAYWSLCRCCREPLYQLRIAELEGEVAKFRICKPLSPWFDPKVENGCYDYGSEVFHGRAVYHKGA